MKRALFFIISALLHVSCKSGGNRGETVGGKEPAEAMVVLSSKGLVGNFPLMPVIEKSLWSKLLEEEAKLAGTPAPGREIVRQRVADLAEKLRSRHPFKMEGDRLELGGIICDRSRQTISLPARVHYPDNGDTRHPDELELLLCTGQGRYHETLFVTETRPLHLELLIHLAGHKKGAQGSRFRIEIIDKEGKRIPVDSLIRTGGGESLERPLIWEFSGSDFNDLYSPDLSGDFAIFWHAHDSVLRVANEGISSGLVKLEPVPHPGLKNGDPVTVELIPIPK